MLAPVLKDKWAHPVLLFTRSILNFWMVSSYQSHNKETLQYMELALYMIDKVKAVFARFRMQKRQLDCHGLEN